MRCFLLLIISFWCLAISTGERAQAQDQAKFGKFGFQNNSVNKPMGLRLDPFAYRGLPFQMGGADIIASLETEIAITDNVRASEDGESDIITSLNPRVEAKREWGRHNAYLLANAEMLQHFDEDDENVENFNGLVGAEFEAMQGLTIPVFLGFTRLFVPREITRIVNEAALTETPLERRSYGGGIGLHYKPNRFGIETDLEYEEIRFENNRFINGAEAIREDRDHDVTRLETTLSYDLTTNWQPRLILAYENQDFLKDSFTNTGFDGANRSNDALSALVGARWNYKDLIIGDLAIGHIERKYDDPAIEDNATLALNAKLEWEPTQRTHLDFVAGRSAVEDNIIVTGLVQTFANAALEYELQRDMFVKGYTSFVHEDFEGESRTDETFQTGLQFKYIANNNWQFGAGYEFETRDSPINSATFTENRFMVNVTGAL